jgi:hypothetical protein
VIAFPPGPPPHVQLVASDTLIIRLHGIVGLSAEFNMLGNVVVGAVHVTSMLRMTEDHMQAVREWGAQKLGVIPEQIQIGARSL